MAPNSREKCKQGQHIENIMDYSCVIGEKEVISRRRYELTVIQIIF